VRIGITIGDPSGIGPLIVSRSVLSTPDVIIFGDRGVLRRAGLPDSIPVVEVTALSPEDSAPGRPTRAGGAAQVAYLEAAVAAAQSNEPEKKIDAIVTAPISKTQAVSAGFAFPGHTEFFAERFGVGDRYAMMFAGPKLKVVLSTIHVSLRELLSSALTKDGIGLAIELGGLALARDFGILRPRIGVLGLNPHAGEGGLFGDDEAALILPGIGFGQVALEQAGVHATVEGPLVPDAAFRKPYDLFVAMYHDQGLIPVKLIDFDLSVNVTLGLPIVRTSPDHGVAYDVAAHPENVQHHSFAAALSLATTLVATRDANRRR
jgi:4-hydroxythreonine-4-phosphate dehydrogenase